jgi:hypothetical protein
MVCPLLEEYVLVPKVLSPCDVSGASAKASTSGINIKARDSVRLTEFVNFEIVIFFVFIFVEAELLNCINRNPVPRGSREPSSQGV